MKQEKLALLVFHVCLIQGNINIPPIIIIIFETALKMCLTTGMTPSEITRKPSIPTNTI